MSELEALRQAVRDIEERVQEAYLGRQSHAYAIGYIKAVLDRLQERAA
jgi:hypothetical protein